MKKFQPSLKLGFTLVTVVALTLAALVWTPVRGKSSANALPPAASRVSVVVTIYIGKPSTCTGFGICKITLGGSLSKRALKGTLTAEDNGKLSLSVEGKAPDEEPTLVIERDMPLSSDVATKLGLKSATITSGSYPFSEGKTVFNARLVK
jgi:hypothetical protein